MDFYTKLFLVNLVAFTSLIVLMTILFTKEELDKKRWLHLVLGVWGLIVLTSVPSWVIYLIVTF